MRRLGRNFIVAAAMPSIAKFRIALPAALGCGLAVALLLATLAAAQNPRTGTGPKETPTYDSPQVEEINKQIRQVWAEWELTPSPPASDGEWCRRVYLDIIGRIPSVDELNAFLNSKSANKKAELVDTLLNDERYQEDYARNWTTIWTNILIGRTGGTGEDTMTNRPGMQKYLRDSFARNKTYDRMVHELVTARGTNVPDDPNFNGAVNFLAAKLNEEDGALATAKTSQIFLGLQVQCTQCHNHPFNDWKQEKFWEMNAFFRQTRALRRFTPGTNDVRMVEVANQDFAGEGNDPSEAELYYELRTGLLKVAYPVFVDGTQIGRSGYLSEVNRRDELAKLIIASNYMPESMVNRTWAHFMGYGFTKPFDDLGAHNPASHPALLTYLGEQFRDHSFDIKQLIRWIVLSEPYSLSSRVGPKNQIDDPTLGEQPKFSRFYLRQMRAEELYESLLVATQAEKTRGSYEEQEKAKAQWLDQFNVAFGTDDGGEATTFNGTITQSLMMFNGDLIKQATGTGKGSFLEQIATSDMPPAKKIEYLFLAGLARKPNAREVSVANQLLYARKGDTAGALQDIWWAVLNSNEFILNH